jgi:hypothetical protein
MGMIGVNRRFFSIGLLEIKTILPVSSPDLAQIWMPLANM